MVLPLNTLNTAKGRCLSAKPNLLVECMEEQSGSCIPSSSHLTSGLSHAILN